MTISILRKIVGSFAIIFMLAPSNAIGASSILPEAKREAEAKGYNFFASHDEIMAGAKKEGKLRVMTGLESPNFEPLMEAFKRKYPFIADVEVREIHGSPEAYQRVLLQIKAGVMKGWDVTRVYVDFVAETIPHLMKHDIYSMAKHGVLQIDPRMVHPGERNIVSITSVLTVVPYNRKLIADDRVPSKWEDFLKPEFKGRKFVLDVRPVQVAGLVPAWGLERTLDFSRKLAAQEPVWGRGATRMTTAVAAGEYPLYLASNYGSVNRAMRKDPTGNLKYKFVEPVPSRVLDQVNGILNTAEHPHAALLWLEFLVSPEGQEIIDKYEPLKASVFSPNSAVAKETQGKKLSLVDWDHFSKFQEYGDKIIEAWGFPKAEKKN